MSNKKRKEPPGDLFQVNQGLYPDKHPDQAKEPTHLEKYLTRFKKHKKNTETKEKEKPIAINLRRLPQFDRGSINLPKEAIIEALYYNHKVCLVFKNGNSRNDYYYKCSDSNCNFTLKISEQKNLINTLTLAGLISNFKDVDIANHSGLEEGICRLTIIGEHVNHAENYEELITKTFESQEGKRSLIILFIFLGILSFVKHIIILEKLYLCKPVNCKSKLEKLLSNNHLDIQIPSLSQLRNFLYRYRERS